MAGNATAGSATAGSATANSLTVRGVTAGIICEIAATMLGTLGKQLVSYSGKVKNGRRARCYKVAGLIVTTIFGPLLDVSAYYLATQSVVAPLNGLDIVWNTCLAPCTLGERLTRSYALGSLLIFLGSSLSPLFGQHHKEAVTLDHLKDIFLSLRFLFYAVASALGLLGCALVLRWRPRGVGDWQRGVALGGAAGFVAGNMYFLSVALGALQESLSTEDWTAWQHPLTYVIALGAVTVAVGNVPLMAKALEEYDALFMITLFAGCQITTACISAQVVLREMNHSTWPTVLGYWACIGLVAAGLLVVGRQARSAAPRGEAPPSAPPAAGASGRAPSGAWGRRVSGLPKAAPQQEGTVVWAGFGSGLGYAGLVEGEEPLLEEELCGGAGAGGASSSSSASGSSESDEAE